MERCIRLLAFDVSLGVGLTAFVLWARATFPGLAGRADGILKRSSARQTFGVGAVIGATGLLLAVLAGKAGEAFPRAGLLAVLILASLAVVAFRGALALWADYGHRLLGVDDAPSDAQAVLAGGALLTGLLFLFPVGHVFFAYVVARSLGVGTLLWVSPKPSPQA